MLVILNQIIFENLIIESKKKVSPLIFLNNIKYFFRSKFFIFFFLFYYYMLSKVEKCQVIYSYNDVKNS